MNETTTDWDEAFDSVGEGTGTRLHGYTLGSLVSSGGFGDVYEAEHDELGSKFVVKVFRGDLLRDPRVRRQFDNEKDILLSATLRSAAHVPRIQDAGVANDRPWIAMERVEGKSLDEWLRVRRVRKIPVAAREIRSILSDVLGALDELQQAHGQKPDDSFVPVFVHQDIKPSNVMVTEGPGGVRAKLIDFGISRLFVKPVNGRVASELTALHNHAMTTPYASPEMLVRATVQSSRAGPEMRLTPSSDLFQVGLLAYEMINVVSDRDRYWNVWPDVEMRRWAPGINRTLRNAVARALAWDPESRFPSVKQFRRHLSWGWRPTIRQGAIAACLLLVVVAVYAFYEQQTSGALRALLQEKEREIAALKLALPGNSAALLEAIRREYRSMWAGNAIDLPLFGRYLESFLSMTPTYPDTQILEQVRRLQRSIDALNTAEVTVAASEIGEDQYWSARMKVRLADPQTGNVRDLPTTSVNKKQQTNLAPLKGRWTPEGYFEVFVVALDGEDEVPEKVTIRFSEPDVLRSTGPVSRRIEVKDQKVWATVTIERSGNPLVDLPMLR